MIPFINFITSFLVVGAAMKVFRRLVLWKATLLLVASVCYVLFCFVAYGKMEGFIQATSIEQMISRLGYDVSELPVSIASMLNGGFCVAIVCNVCTSVWIGRVGSFWKWCLAVAVCFCAVCACCGPLVGMSPLFSLFIGCCGFMATIGWILGLTYVEACVIGNIWFPGVLLLVAGSYLVYALLQVCRSRGVSVAFKVSSFFVAVLGALQILFTILILAHYAGTMKYAFSTCVADLNAIAGVLHTSYEAVNILIYVFGLVILQIGRAHV